MREFFYLFLPYFFLCDRCTAWYVYNYMYNAVLVLLCSLYKTLLLVKQLFNNLSNILCSIYQAEICEDAENKLLAFVFSSTRASLHCLLSRTGPDKLKRKS